MSHNRLCDECGAVISPCDQLPHRVTWTDSAAAASALIVRDDLPDDPAAADAIRTAEAVVECPYTRACLDDRDHSGDSSIFETFLCPTHYDQWIDEIAEARLQDDGGGDTP